MNNYLIPANSKKSMLILGIFNKVDLVVFYTGVTISTLLLVMIKTSDLGKLLLMISPALFSALMIMPTPPYHNVMTLLGNILRYYTGIKKYYWRGWCASYDEQSKRDKRS